MNGLPGSTTLLLPSNLYPKRTASPKRHIQQIVITQSTTTFAQSAAHHQNHQHRQNHLNVLNSLEGTSEKKQTGFHLKNLKDLFIDSDPFKKYQKNLKRFQFNQQPIQDSPPDEELVPTKLVPASDPDTHNNGSDDYSDEDTFNEAENIPIQQEKQQKKVDSYPDIETQDPDNRPIRPGKQTYDDQNYSDGADSFDDVENRLVNVRENRPVQKPIFSRTTVQKIQPESTPFYQKEAAPKYRRANKDVNVGQSDSSSNPGTKSGRDLTTKTPENTPSSESPGLEQVSNLIPCRYCNRKFAKGRLETHEEICERTLNKQRNKYDATGHRLKGTDIEAYKFKKGDTGGSRRQGRQDIGRQTSSRFGNVEPSFPGNVTSGTRTKPEQRQSINRKASAKVNSNLNSPSRYLQGDKIERGRKVDAGRPAVTNRKSKFEDEPTQHPSNKLGPRKGCAGSQIEITRKSSANVQSHSDKFGTRKRADSARQSDLNRKPSATFEDASHPPTNYGARPKAGAGSRSNTTRQSSSLFDDPPVGDKFENRDLNKKGSKSPTRSLPALNRNKKR